MLGVEISRTGPDVGIAINRIADAVQEEQAHALFEAAEYLAGEIRETAMRLHPDGSGQLPRSFRAQLLSVGKDQVAAIAGSDLVYADYRDRGGTIYPHKQYLAIPLKFAGLPRGIWPRDMGKLKFIPRKGKNPLLAGASSEGRAGSPFSKNRNKIRPLFVLVRRVTQRGSGYLQEALDGASGTLEEMIAVLHEAAIGRAS